MKNRLNLQLCMPNEKCIFNCAYCISKGKKHNYEFADLFTAAPTIYEKRLRNAYRMRQYKSITLTGEADPTQNFDFIKRTLNILLDEKTKMGLDTTIEIQTKNTKASLIAFPFSVVAYSIDNIKSFEQVFEIKQMYYVIDNPTIIRPVIILTNTWTKEQLETVLRRSKFFKQVTFKVLQHGESQKVNDWIDNNRFEHNDWLAAKIEEAKETNKFTSFFFDVDCMNTEGRYEIFRSDGKVYATWEAKESIGDLYGFYSTTRSVLGTTKAQIKNK